MLSSAITVSGSVVGEYGRSGLAKHYTDGSHGTEVRLNFPYQLAKLNEQTLLIVEDGSHMVRKYDIESDIATSLAGKFGEKDSYEGPDPLGKACFIQPRGIAASADGKYVYVANFLGHFINRINVDEDSVERVAGNPMMMGKTVEGPALGTNLTFPEFLAIDPDGHLVIADLNSIHRLENDPQHGDPRNGMLVKLANGKQSIAFHPYDGTAIISSSSFCLHHVKFNDPAFEPSVIGKCGEKGLEDGAPSEARFGSIAPALWSSDGEVLFIADTYNNCIRYMPRDLSFVGTLAGSGTQGNDAGSGEEATLDSPSGLVLMHNTLYFSQTSGRNIRKIGMFAAGFEF